MALIFDKTASITASTTWELDVINLSEIRALRIQSKLTAPGGLVGDTLDIYFQVRFANGLWADRVAFAQLLGNGGAKYSFAEIQTDIPLDSAEEIGAMLGPSPLSAHLAAGTVVNGALPPFYLGDITNLLGRGPNSQPLTCARFEFVESGTSTWPLRITVDADERNPGY